MGVLEAIFVNSVEAFKYIESIIHQDESLHREEKRINEGRKVISVSNPVLGKGNNLPKAKRLICISIVQRILFCSLEICTLDLPKKETFLY